MRARCASAVPLALLFLFVCTTSIAQSSDAQVPEPQFPRTTVSVLGGGVWFMGAPETTAGQIIGGPAVAMDLMVHLGDRPFFVGLHGGGSFHALREGEDNLRLVTALARYGFKFILAPRVSLAVEAYGGARIGIVYHIPGADWATGLGLSGGFLLRNGMEVVLHQTGTYWHGFGVSVDSRIGVAIPIGPRRRLAREEEPALRPEPLEDVAATTDGAETDKIQGEELTPADESVDEEPATEVATIDVTADDTAPPTRDTTAPATEPEPEPKPEPEPPPPEPEEPPEPAIPSDQTDGTIAVTDLSLQQIFPVFYKYYNNNPLGGATIANLSRTVVQDLEVKFFVPRYMDAARTASGPSRIPPGESIDLSFTALFADEIVTVTAATVATAQIEVSYRVGGAERTLSFDVTLDIADRNATTWDDDRKVAAFVTPNDPAVLVISRGAAAVVRTAGFTSVNEPLQKAMGVFEALRLYGLQYVIDPSTPFAQYSREAFAVDYLQYPQQTIQYRAGDCDDLSICFAAALQSVGVRPAFITVPGHIFTAFATGLSPNEARRTFSRADELIFTEDEAWIPIETTLLSDGFLRAWEQGAKTWRENSVREQAEIYSLEAAWQLYEGVGLRDTGYLPEPPSQADVDEAYRSQMTRFIDREIFPQVADLQSRIDSSGGDARYINRLGVLYGRYGLDDRARSQFERVLERDPVHGGALVNLGHLCYLAGDMDQALTYYERALATAPDNPRIVLAVARAHHELENYGLVSRHYESLVRLDPELAIRFSYLDFRGDEATRAAEIANITDVVVWEEEE